MNSRLPASHSTKHNTGVNSYSRIMKKKSPGLEEEDNDGATVSMARARGQWQCSLRSGSRRRPAPSPGMR
jgi:hypothetical protein